MTMNTLLSPKAAKELDNALVSQPLDWLSSYPKAHEAFIKALKDYAEAATDTASEVADKFRKALEAFFQEFFGGNKSLENYKTDYGNYLKAHGIPKEISSNLETCCRPIRIISITTPSTEMPPAIPCLNT